VDTELLRTFLEVRNTRHFGRAADNLCITQAAVSARIKQLEEALGAPLFLRNRNNIQLSREGERLLPHAETVMLALARARQEVHLGERDSQRLVIGVRRGVWGGPLQSRLYALQLAQPELVLQLDSLESPDLLRRLLDHTVDLAILPEPPALPELETVTLGELNLRLFSSRGRHSASSAMAGGYVYLDWGGGFARFHARHFGEQALPRLRTNLEEVARAYLTECGGACYFPASRKAELAPLGLAPVRGAPVFSRSLQLAYRGDTGRESLIAAVTRHFSAVRL
jgi:DNA-binding transcriptional LysR family regulator